MWARGCVRRRGLDSSCWSCFMKIPKIQPSPATKATPHQKERLNNVAVFKGQWWLISHINQLLNSSHFESSVGQVGLAVKALSSLMEDAKTCNKGKPFVFMEFRWWKIFSIYIWFLECTARILHECFIARTSKNVCHSLIDGAWCHQGLWV